MAEESRGAAAEPNGKPKKRIVICADGTWNDPEEEHPTNVLRMARAIRPEDPRGVQQVVFYDWGVGSYHARIRGGVWGIGLQKNIQDCYRFIVQNYDENDELFLFGYSRGAYTVRALAGFLNKCGILGRDRADQIPEAFKYYKCRASMPGSPAAEEWRKCHGVKARGQVRFLGVWDTVGSRGIPKRVLGFVEEEDIFYDAKLGRFVQVARHAVAIDEKRADFPPTLWKEEEEEAGPKTDEKPKGKPDVKQVWFAGVHSDIGGGGGPKNGGSREKRKKKGKQDKPESCENCERAERGEYLSDVALAWMADEARAEGLALEDHLHGDTSNLHKLERHRSYKRHWRAFGRKKRKVPVNALVHVSVKKRHEESKHGKREYAPEALRCWLEVQDGWDSADFVS